MPPISSRYEDEAERLRVLESFEAEALEDDPELSAIVEFAAQLCNVAASMVTLIDGERQYFLVRKGVEERETPRGYSFCVHALGNPGIMEVPDATKDARFVDNPFVTDAPHVRYYAGQPLVSDEGAPLGTLCVIDVEPRESGLDAFQRQGLAVLARAAMRRLRERREGLRAERAIAEREMRLQRMIDALPQIAWSASQVGEFDYFNSRWHELTGAEEPKGVEAWRAFIHPDDYDNTLKAWGEAFEQGHPFEGEFRLKQKDGSWHWVLALAVPETEGQPGARRWFGTLTDIDEVQKLSHSRDMLAKELSHRIKNIFAVVTGLISLQARKQPEHGDFAGQINEVLQALGRAHDYVRPAGGSTQESLQGLLAILFSPYRDDRGEPRILVSGDDCAIAPSLATPFALVFHELATNSSKYGALSADGGHVTLELEDRGEKLLLRWSEHGGPPPGETGDQGFGSRMVELAVTGQLQGSWERRFEPTGMVAELLLSKQAIAP